MDEETIKYLLSIGALEYSHNDEDGEPVYRFTKDASTMVPDIYEEQMQDFNALVFQLWNKDMIDVFFDDDGDPIIGLNGNSENKDKIELLDIDEKDAMKEIISFWNQVDEEE